MRRCRIAGRYAPDMASLTGTCMCGAVRFEVTEPFETAGYCHCSRCQHRTGVPTGAVSGMVPAAGVTVLAGEELVRVWTPDEGFPKAFCGVCGGHVWAGDPSGDGTVAVRLGALDSDPGVELTWHQWVGSLPAWVELPDDGLPRFDGPRRHD
jgi:hypothetical protein